MNAKIPLCKIDQEGVYKYIQIECINKDNKDDKKIIIRGDGNCSYHKDIFRKFLIDIMNSNDKNLKENYEYECIGGGRIEFKPDCILIYGYSSGYGQADHEKTKEIIKKFFPTYKVETSNEGY
jgi:phosphohistidine phosphatase